MPIKCPQNKWTNLNIVPAFNSSNKEVKKGWSRLKLAGFTSWGFSDTDKETIKKGNVCVGATAKKCVLGDYKVEYTKDDFFQKCDYNNNCEKSAYKILTVKDSADKQLDNLTVWKCK